MTIVLQDVFERIGDILVMLLVGRLRLEITIVLRDVFEHIGDILVMLLVGRLRLVITIHICLCVAGCV